MFRGFIGQVVGIASIPLWLALTVYFMSRASVPNATDSGNWFVAFAATTLVFVAIMTFWRRFFAE